METIDIIPTKIPIADIYQNILSENCGAVCTFSGTTRNFFQANSVKFLFYEAYHSMALKEMKKIVKNTKEKFSVEKVAVVHRIGKVLPKEESIFIAVASTHRKDAFAACEFIVDRVKKQVPIWKKESFSDGQTRWLN